MRGVLSVLAGRGLEVPPFWRQVLSDTIDADLLDYLRRDAYFTGLELRYDQRVREYFRVDRRSQRCSSTARSTACCAEDIASELLRLLEIRYHFSERVYYHHAKIAAGALVARMVELALRAAALTPAELQTATDESLLFRLEALGNSSLGGLEPDQRARLRRFMAAFRRRRLLKRVIVLPAYLNAGVQDLLLETWFRRGAPEARYEWEAEVEREAKRVLGRDLDVVMYCPARRMQLKEARTLVRFPGTEGAIEPLETYVDSVPRLRDLRDSYPRLWKLYVFTSEPDLEARRRLQQICLERLPAGVVNALRL
jgi:HD superfamily phosphohydrolase